MSEAQRQRYEEQYTRLLTWAQDTRIACQKWCGASAPECYTEGIDGALIDVHTALDALADAVIQTGLARRRTTVALAHPIVDGGIAQ